LGAGAGRRPWNSIFAAGGFRDLAHVGAAAGGDGGRLGLERHELGR